MKIVKLVSENIKRLHAVEITPDGTLITIGGKNGAGKSSVLDSIAYALGGASLVPPEPIHGDETEARIEVDLGDYVVTRRFKRDRTVTHGEAFWSNLTVSGVIDHTCDETCTTSFSPTRSVLQVKSKEGATYPSPQAMLDKLIGQLSFDPLAFSRMDAKLQDATLRKLVGLDTTLLDSKRAATASKRAELRRQIRTAEERLQLLAHYDQVPDAELSMTTVTDELKRAEELMLRANEAEAAVVRQDHIVEKVNESVRVVEKRVADLEVALASARNELVLAHKSAGDAVETRHALMEVSLEVRKAVPDASIIRARITEVQDINAKVRANQRHAEMKLSHDELVKHEVEEAAAIKKLDVAKEGLLTSVVFPIAGLGFGENGVTFNDKPFEQASTSEQLRTSVAIGLALNPQLKVLLIRDGNHLDEDSLKMVAEMAEKAEAQIWLEWVTKSKEGVTVLIEDGHVA